MKIDVEGFESCVFAGGKKLFHEHGVAVIYLEVVARAAAAAAAAAAAV